MSRITIPAWGSIRGKPDFAALYQSILVSGTNIKTINGQSLLGSGDIVVSAGTVTWATIEGKPTEFPPSAHNHTSAQISDFSEAVDDEVATLLQAGTDVSVTYNDAANTLTVGLGANVPRLNAANTFTATQTIGATASANLDLRNASNVLYAQFNGTNRSFYAGGDAFAVLIDGTARLYNNGVIAWNNGSIASSGAIDVSVRRNATGPTLETRAAGGLKVCNAAGSAVANVECANITAALISCGTYTVATLPSAAANAGRLAQVTDSSVTTNGSAVAGGGSNRVLVFSTGSTWDVVVA